jgi:hypothetical protein
MATSVQEEYRETNNTIPPVTQREKPRDKYIQET